jgi:serine/threonine protein kinase
MAVVTHLEDLGYQGIRKIGGGSYGSVYFAEKDGKKYAIKVIEIVEDREEGTFRSGLREYVVGRFSQPQYHLVPLRSAEYIKEIGFVLVYDYVEGPSLEIYRKRADITALYNLNFLDNVLKSVLEALIFLHSIGIAHRDVKPANIIFDLERKDIKLADYGTACWPQSQECDDEIGTQAYFPLNYYTEGYPLNDLERLKRGDLFALGVTIYYLLENAYPYLFYKKGDDILPEDIKEKLPMTRDALQAQILNVNAISDFNHKWNDVLEAVLELVSEKRVDESLFYRKLYGDKEYDRLFSPNIIDKFKKPGSKLNTQEIWRRFSK